MSDLHWVQHQTFVARLREMTDRWAIVFVHPDEDEPASHVVMTVETFERLKGEIGHVDGSD